MRLSFRDRLYGSCGSLIFHLGIKRNIDTSYCSNAFLHGSSGSTHGQFLVNPKDGQLIGVLDWEFANTIPLQAKEQYPCFLGTMTSVWEKCGKVYDDGDAEYKHGGPTIPNTLSTIMKWLNDRIDAVSRFGVFTRLMNFGLFSSC